MLHQYTCKTAELPVTNFLLLLFLFLLTLTCPLMEQDILRRMTLFCKAAAEVHELYGFVTNQLWGHSVRQLCT